jgi:hypothetical protein
VKLTEETPEELTTNTGEFVVKYKLPFEFCTSKCARILRCVFKYFAGGQNPNDTVALAQKCLGGREKKAFLKKDASHEIKDVTSVELQTDIFADMFV